MVSRQNIRLHFLLFLLFDVNFFCFVFARQTLMFLSFSLSFLTLEKCHFLRYTYNTHLRLLYNKYIYISLIKRANRFSLKAAQ